MFPAAFGSPDKYSRTSFGTMKICSGQGFELMSVNHSKKSGGIIGIYFQFSLI